ncbi:fasciclin domain-containing protein [Aurantimonas sp. A2-1-M11]|uniref:fasciclin domain-containing protein n=1 Tax=Aurantimonas sp. A2-1-M11 TaxID=3113712 RepID=UPI002F92F163
MIKEDSGAHNCTTVEDAMLPLNMDGDLLDVIDKSGGGAEVTKADLMRSNGAVHVIDFILMPK